MRILPGSVVRARSGLCRHPSMGVGRFDVGEYDGQDMDFRTTTMGSSIAIDDDWDEEHFEEVEGEVRGDLRESEEERTV